jgi:hypothetical protein
MKGAFLLSRDDRLFEDAKRALVGFGGQYFPKDGVVQLRDETGGLFTLFDNAEPRWEYAEGPLTAAPGVELPDISQMKGLAVECRNEQQFALVVQAIDSANASDVWVVDGDGVVWPASAVDPQRVRL